MEWEGKGGEQANLRPGQLSSSCPTEPGDSSSCTFYSSHRRSTTLLGTQSAVNTLPSSAQSGHCSCNPWLPALTDLTVRRPNSISLRPLLKLLFTPTSSICGINQHLPATSCPDTKGSVSASQQTEWLIVVCAWL